MKKKKKTNLEIIGTGREELIAHMQCMRSLDPPKVALAGAHAPGLVADVDEDVVAA